jgi:hypothetical protein
LLRVRNIHCYFDSVVFQPAISESVSDV